MSDVLRAHPVITVIIDERGAAECIEYTKIDIARCVICVPV